MNRRILTAAIAVVVLAVGGYLAVAVVVNVQQYGRVDVDSAKGEIVDLVGVYAEAIRAENRPDPSAARLAELADAAPAGVSAGRLAVLQVRRDPGLSLDVQAQIEYPGAVSVRECYRIDTEDLGTAVAGFGIVPLARCPVA